MGSELLRSSSSAAAAAMFASFENAWNAELAGEGMERLNRARCKGMMGMGIAAGFRFRGTL